jgi:hypothetical protein
VPLSEEELRLLEQMERALVAEDPKFASALRGTTVRRNARRRSFIAGGVFLLGVAVMMAGAVMGDNPGIVLGIVGFVVMLGSAYVALTSWRGQNNVAEAEAAQAAGRDSADNAFGLSVVEGGKSKKRSSRGRPSSHSMMERFEERWRRRRDNPGGR